jgi:hypothetical protein
MQGLNIGYEKILVKTVCKNKQTNKQTNQFNKTLGTYTKFSVVVFCLVMKPVPNRFRLFSLLQKLEGGKK